MPGPTMTAEERRHISQRSSTREGFAGILLISVMLLVPCFWQSRIQATDLSSHVYNAWLASLVAKGQASGLYTVRQLNNVAFDLALQWLLTRFGAGAAQRIAVSICVLIFSWGAIAFVTRVSGRNVWFTIPCVALLAYGSIYHLGFFNFYLSLGICFWFLALLWRANWRLRLLTAPLLLLAWLAHPFPAVWAIGIAGYIVMAENLTPLRRMWLFGVATLLLCVARQVLMGRFLCSWSWRQVFFTTGANQVMVFGDNYVVVLALLLFLWLLTFRRLLKKQGVFEVLASLPFQLWLLNAAAVFLLPNVIDFPGYALPFSFVTDRLSLATGIMACALLAAVPVRRPDKPVLILVTAIFFGMIFSYTRNLNRLEDQIDALVARLPPAQRVLGFFPTNIHRISPLNHAVDRACIGHCFSYGNYEPASRQFRLRATPGNPYVLSDFTRLAAVERGEYVVESSDLPVYLIYLCGDSRDRVCSRSLQAGEITGK